jgi:2-aminoadipate transaminase
LGYRPLREAIVADLRARDADCPDIALDQVIITAGSNQLLHLVSDTLLNPGDIVLCAAPTYLVYLGTLSNLGVRSVGVAVDQDGVVPEALHETLQQCAARGELSRVKAIYLVPYFDNPCGVTMPLARRREVVEIAKRWSTVQQIHVIADEAYRDLRYEAADVASMLTVDEDGDTVIVTGTFSKSFSPGLRVGWGILPRALVEPVCSQKGNNDFGSPNFNQHLMQALLTRGLFAAHLERIRPVYREKRDALLRALETHFGALDDVQWRVPAGGLYVWLQLPPGISTGPSGGLFDAALQEGVLYVPGEFFYPNLGEPACENTLRLSFGVQALNQLDRGVAALARALHDSAVHDYSAMTSDQSN